jgi:hypothetical protein
MPVHSKRKQEGIPLSFIAKRVCEAYAAEDPEPPASTGLPGEQTITIQRGKTIGSRASIVLFYHKQNSRMQNSLGPMAYACSESVAPSSRSSNGSIIINIRIILEINHNLQKE